MGHVTVLVAFLYGIFYLSSPPSSITPEGRPRLSVESKVKGRAIVSSSGFLVRTITRCGRPILLFSIQISYFSYK